MRKVYLQPEGVDTVATPPEEWSDSESAVVVTPHIALAADMDGVYFYIFDQQIGDAAYLNSDEADLVVLNTQGVNLAMLDLEVVAELFEEFASFLDC